MPIYMQYGDVKGDVTVAKHIGWIELLSAQFGVHNNVTNPTGQSATRDKTASEIMTQIVVTKYIDSSSQGLFKESLWGQGKKVVIEFLKGGESFYLQVSMEDTLISSYSVSGHGGNPNTNPIEMLTLNFTKMKFDSRTNNNP